jgi:hypothetical protein
MVEAEEVEPLAVHLQVDDPGLGLLRLQAEFGQQALQPLQGGFGLLAAGAHHHRVVGTAHQHPVIPCRPRPVQPVQIDIGQQRGDNPAVGSAGHRPTDLPVLHDPGPQHRAQAVQLTTATQPLTKAGARATPRVPALCHNAAHMSDIEAFTASQFDHRFPSGHGKCT